MLDTNLEGKVKISSIFWQSFWTFHQVVYVVRVEYLLTLLFSDTFSRNLEEKKEQKKNKKAFSLVTYEFKD